jgi:N-acetylmuramic acid 6-phosphate etherase
VSREWEQLVTESRLDASFRIDEVPTEEMLRLINDQDAQVAGAVRPVIPAVARAVDQVSRRLRDGGRLRYVGAGTSGRLGVLDASECPPTFGVPPDLVQGIIAGGREAVFRTIEGEEDDEEAGVREIRAAAAPADAVIGIAASGSTPYTLAALQEARRLGCLTVAITCNPGSPLGAAAEIAIEPSVGPEVIMGSTRMKSGTAQKLILNMISTGVMVRLGKVFSNLMVDMVASNRKLRDRARRIVRIATGAAPVEAARALDEAGGQAKTAIVILLAGASRLQAESALAVAGGRVREALAALRRV